MNYTEKGKDKIKKISKVPKVWPCERLQKFAFSDPLQNKTFGTLLIDHPVVERLKGLENVSKWLTWVKDNFAILWNSRMCCRSPT